LIVHNNYLVFALGPDNQIDVISTGEVVSHAIAHANVSGLLLANVYFLPMSGYSQSIG